MILWLPWIMSERITYSKFRLIWVAYFFHPENLDITDVVPIWNQLNWAPSKSLVTSWYARWRLKSSVSPLFTQPFIRAQIKENIKAPRHWPLCGEFTGDRWGIHRWSMNSPHKWLVTRKMFPFDYVIIYAVYCHWYFKWESITGLPAVFHYCVQCGICIMCGLCALYFIITSRKQNTERFVIMLQ